MIDHASEKMPDFENQNNTASEVVEARFAVVSKDFIENLLGISSQKNKESNKIWNKECVQKGKAFET